MSEGKVYYAFDPSMIGKVITHRRIPGPNYHGGGYQQVGKLRDYSILESGETYYTMDGDITDVTRTLIEGDTITVYSWDDPNTALERIALSLEARF